MQTASALQGGSIPPRPHQTGLIVDSSPPVDAKESFNFSMTDASNEASYRAVRARLTTGFGSGSPAPDAPR